jgi:zinc transport system permease protein
MAWWQSIPLLSHLLLAESNGMRFIDALPLLTNGLLASGLTAVVCAFLGVYVILKRMVFVSAALTQLSSLGVVLALFLAERLSWEAAAAVPAGDHGPVALTTAASLLFACLAAWLLAMHTQERRLTRESLLGIGYVLPAGLSLLLLDRLLSHPGLLEEILFGNAVFVAPRQLRLLTLVCAAVLAVHSLFYKAFVFTAFDPETASAAGLPTRLLHQILFLTLAMTTSIAIGTIGALPVFAFLVIPGAAALLCTARLWCAFLLAMGIGGTAAVVGFYLSFLFAFPTGPTMIVTAGLALPAGLLIRWWGRL